VARSSQAEPVEKFRFMVNFFTLKPNSPLGLGGSLLTGGFKFDNPLKTHLSDDNGIAAGFSEVVPPAASVKVIEYRENTYMNRTTKQAGLVSYEPVVLRRGVTAGRGLYNWYKDVHNDVYDLNSGNQILAEASLVPVHDPRYRKEMIISVLDREGFPVKHWLCVNCFPIGYKGSDGLDASDESKAIEELTITYEAFVELPAGDINSAFESAQKEANKAMEAAWEATALGGAIGAAKGILS
jgi:phage tail-like protein